MKNNNTTSVVVFGLIIVAVVYDLYAILFGGVSSSISQLITDTVGNYPLPMFVSGMLVDHFFGFTMRRRI